MPEREVHVAGRAEAVVQETFGRFEQPERAAFHVECTTTPDETLREISRERGVRPIRFRPGLDRDDVDVRHQQDRFTRWVGAFPSVEEAVAAVDLAVEASVNPGERRPQELMELLKGRCVTGSVGPGRDRAEPERSGQPFLEAPERLDGVNLVDLNLFRGEGDHVPDDRADKGGKHGRDQPSEHLDASPQTIRPVTSLRVVRGWLGRAVMAIRSRPVGGFGSQRRVAPWLLAVA